MFVIALFFSLFLSQKSRNEDTQTENQDDLLDSAEEDKNEDNIQNINLNQRVNSMKGHKITNDDTENSPKKPGSTKPKSKSKSKSLHHDKKKKAKGSIDDDILSNVQLSLSELKKIKFYVQLLSDKIVPKEVHEAALKRRLDTLKKKVGIATPKKTKVKKPSTKAPHSKTPRSQAPRSPAPIPPAPRSPTPLPHAPQATSPTVSQQIPLVNQTTAQ